MCFCGVRLILTGIDQHVRLLGLPVSRFLGVASGSVELPRAGSCGHLRHVAMFVPVLSTQLEMNETDEDFRSLVMARFVQDQDMASRMLEDVCQGIHQPRAGAIEVHTVLMQTEAALALTVCVVHAIL